MSTSRKRSERSSSLENIWLENQPRVTYSNKNKGKRTGRGLNLARLSLAKILESFKCEKHKIGGNKTMKCTTACGIDFSSECPPYLPGLNLQESSYLMVYYTELKHQSNSVLFNYLKSQKSVSLNNTRSDRPILLFIQDPNCGNNLRDLTVSGINTVMRKIHDIALQRSSNTNAFQYIPNDEKIVTVNTDLQVKGLFSTQSAIHLDREGRIYLGSNNYYELVNVPDLNLKISTLQLTPILELFHDAVSPYRWFLVTDLRTLLNKLNISNVQRNLDMSSHIMIPEGILKMIRSYLQDVGSPSVRPEVNKQFHIKVGENQISEELQQNRSPDAEVILLTSPQLIKDNLSILASLQTHLAVNPLPPKPTVNVDNKAPRGTKSAPSKSEGNKESKDLNSVNQRYYIICPTYLAKHLLLVTKLLSYAVDYAKGLFRMSEAELVILNLKGEIYASFERWVILFLELCVYINNPALNAKEEIVKNTLKELEVVSLPEPTSLNKTMQAFYEKFKSPIVKLLLLKLTSIIAAGTDSKGKLTVYKNSKYLAYYYYLCSYSNLVAMVALKVTPVCDMDCLHHWYKKTIGSCPLEVCRTALNTQSIMIILDTDETQLKKSARSLEYCTRFIIQKLEKSIPISPRRIIIIRRQPASEDAPIPVPKRNKNKKKKSKPGSNKNKKRNWNVQSNGGQHSTQNCEGDDVNNDNNETVAIAGSDEIQNKTQNVNPVVNDGLEENKILKEKKDAIEQEKATTEKTEHSEKNETSEKNAASVKKPNIEKKEDIKKREATKKNVLPLPLTEDNANIRTKVKHHHLKRDESTFEYPNKKHNKNGSGPRSTKTPKQDSSGNKKKKVTMPEPKYVRQPNLPQTEKCKGKMFTVGYSSKEVAKMEKYFAPKIVEPTTKKVVRGSSTMTEPIPSTSTQNSNTLKDRTSLKPETKHDDKAKKMLVYNLMFNEELCSTKGPAKKLHFMLHVSLKAYGEKLDSVELFCNRVKNYIETGDCTEEQIKQFIDETATLLNAVYQLGVSIDRVTVTSGLGEVTEREDELYLDDSMNDWSLFDYEKPKEYRKKVISHRKRIALLEMRLRQIMKKLKKMSSQNVVKK